MTQKAFIVRKERKQSHCRRRRKPAFPNCASIDEPLSDNALVYFCLVSPLQRCTGVHWWCSRFRIIFFYMNIHRRRMLIEVNINGGRCAIGWREFTRAFIKAVKAYHRKKCMLLKRVVHLIVAGNVNQRARRERCIHFINCGIKPFFSFLFRLIHRNCGNIIPQWLAKVTRTAKSRAIDTPTSFAPRCDSRSAPLDEKSRP